MLLSSVPFNGVLRINGKIAIVVSRFAEDRSSGGTVLEFEDGHRRQFLWDYENPEVEFLGKGRRVTKIEFLPEDSFSFTEDRVVNCDSGYIPDDICFRLKYEGQETGFVYIVAEGAGNDTTRKEVFDMVARFNKAVRDKSC